MASSDESDGDFVPGQGQEQESENESPRRKDVGGSDSDDDDDPVGDDDGGSGDDDDEEEEGEARPKDVASPGKKGKGRKRKRKEKGELKSQKKKKKKKKKGRGDGLGKEKDKRRKKPNVAAMFDEQAEESDPGEDGASDDEDEDDDNEYQMDGFVVGDDEIDGDDEDRGRRRRKGDRDKKQRRLRRLLDSHGPVLADDEDLELVREAEGVREVPEYDRNELKAADGRDLGKQLFQDAGAEALAEERRQDMYGGRRSMPRERDEFDTDDDGDFLVDDLGTGSVQGRQPQEGFHEGISGPSQEQVHEAMEIFGEGIQGFMKSGEAEDVEMTRDEKRAEARRKAHAAIEPSILKDKFLTPEDRLIQETDRPERLQLRMPARGEPSDEERHDEANWIFHQLDLGYGIDEKMAVEAVEHVLRFLGVESQEVPFIWHYRRDYLWTGENTFLSRTDLWKIYDLDETWDKVSNRREKVAKVSSALWRLMHGDDGSDAEDDQGYSSESPDARDERLAAEKQARETRAERLRRAELALERSRKALAKAETESADGPDPVNERRLEEAREAKAKQVAARVEAGEEDVNEEVADSDWTRATEESLAEALEEAKETFKHSGSYVVGLKGELAVEEEEESTHNKAREDRRRERREVAMRERQRRRDEARRAVEEEAALFPREQYSFLQNSQDEIELKDLQEYLSLVSAMGETEEKLRGAAMAAGGQARRPRRAGRTDDTFYRAARQAGLRGLANKFSISAVQLGDLVCATELDPVHYDVPTPAEPVDLVASDMAGASDTPVFDSSDSILRGVRHILAREIAAEPRVKAKCRQVYRNCAVISTSPTDKGIEEIDAFHPLYGLHYLERKPLTKFMDKGGDGTQWLKIDKGKNEGLLKYTVHPPERKAESLDENGRLVVKYELDKAQFLRIMGPAYNPGGGVARGLEMLSGISLPVRQGWDQQRDLVLQEALTDYMLPAFETEVLMDLRTASKTAVVEESSAALAARLAVGPYERQELTVAQKIVKIDSDGVYDQIRVVGVYVSPDARDQTWAAAVDFTGSVLDHLQLPFNRDERAKTLKSFLKATRPNVVCISTSAGQASRMMMDLLVDRRSGQNGEPRQGLVDDAQREYDHEQRDDSVDMDIEDDRYSWKHCEVIFAKDDVATIFSRSPRSQKEFPEFVVNQRAAVGLARYMQDPLLEFAGMWTVRDTSGNFGGETFSLRLHPLQDEVPPQQLLRVWMHRLMDAVSDVGVLFQVDPDVERGNFFGAGPADPRTIKPLVRSFFLMAAGVDINHASELEHAMGVLQFVPGLGPRKAAKMREKIGPALGGLVPSRKAMLSSQLMKSLVYTNAAGFLRVRKRGRLAERLEGQVDPFDDTRVHPECYNTQDWAQRICANALDVQVSEDQYFTIVESAMEDSREALKKHCLQDLNVDPRIPPMNLNDSVNQLDLTAYAEELKRQGEGKRGLQLDSIVEEIRYPYRDRRQPVRHPSEDELFEWLTGETDATLREGVLVPVRVTKHAKHGVRVRLEGGPGLFGYVPADYVTDDVLPSDPISGKAAPLSSVVKVNQVMEAAVIKVDKGRYELKLSLRKSDTQPNPDKWDEPAGAPRVFGASGWNRPPTLPPLDDKFNVIRAKQEARDRIRETQKKALERAARASTGGLGGVPTFSVRFPRSILHPQFKNMTHLEAEQYLKENANGRGEALIRPSSKGPDHLSLTWNWMEGEFMHSDIQEVGKQPGSMLAPRLKIRGEEYEDLDEIISRRVSACNDLVDDLLVNPKYHPGTVEEVAEVLRTKKAEEPARLPYFICRRGIPGYLNIMYLPGNTMRKEVVEVTPDGYSLARRSFKTMHELFKWFKTNAHLLGTTRVGGSRRGWP